MTDASSSTVDENGTNATTAYSFAEVDGSTTTQVETDDSLSGISTTTQVESSTSSLHEIGSESGSGAYTLDKTTTGYLDTTQVDDAETGDYTLSGTEGTSSTVIESNTHGSYSALYTEILTDDSTISEEGSDLSGQYVLSQTGTQSDNYVDAGTDASGSYDVTEGSTGSYAQTTDGDNSTGITVIQTTTTTGYSMTEVVSGSENYTLTEHGTDTPTGTQTVNTVTGDYSIVENGTDLYTLSETGTLTGAFTDTVVGTDGYSSNEVGNTIQQTDSETTTGGGSWTRTDTGGTLSSGSGTNAYTLVESGDQAAGSFTQAETGTDRYGLVESFDDVSNTGSGSTPGNVTFHSHGLAFQDPTTDTPETRAQLMQQTYDALVKQLCSPEALKAYDGFKEADIKADCELIAKTYVNRFFEVYKPYLKDLNNIHAGWMCYQWMSLMIPTLSKLNLKCVQIRGVGYFNPDANVKAGESQLVHNYISVSLGDINDGKVAKRPVAREFSVLLDPWWNRSPDTFAVDSDRDHKWNTVYEKDGTGAFVYIPDDKMPVQFMTTGTLKDLADEKVGLDGRKGAFPFMPTEPYHKDATFTFIHPRGTTITIPYVPGQPLTDWKPK